MAEFNKVPAQVVNPGDKIVFTAAASSNEHNPHKWRMDFTYYIYRNDARFSTTTTIEGPSFKDAYDKWREAYWKQFFDPVYGYIERLTITAIV